MFGQQEVARAFGDEGQADELQQRPADGQTEQDGPQVVSAEDLGQAEHLREQHGDRDAELVYGADSAPVREW